MKLRRLTFTRRSALLFLFFSATAALLTRFTRVAFSFLESPTPAGSFGGIVEVGPLHELPEAGSAPRHNGRGRFWLVHDDGGVRAIHSTCTHLKCLFSWDQEKQNFVCPCHGSEFGSDGRLLRGPATRDLDLFPVLLVDEDDHVVARTDVDSAGPVAVQGFYQQIDSEQSVDTTESRQKRSVITVRVDTGQKLAGLDRSAIL